MDDASGLKRKIATPVAFFWKVSVSVLAAVGLLWLAGGPVLRFLTAPMFATETVDRFRSPDGVAVAEVEVRKGGFGMVWTTRVHLQAPGKGPWTIYQSKDSEFTPPLSWIDTHTLLVGFPCGRFDHLSNPDDWENEFAPRPERLKVRFERPDCD